MAPSQARGEIECVKIVFRMPNQCYGLEVVVNDSALELHEPQLPMSTSIIQRKRKHSHEDSKKRRKLYKVKKQTVQTLSHGFAARPFWVFLVSATSTMYGVRSSTYVVSDSSFTLCRYDCSNCSKKKKKLCHEAMKQAWEYIAIAIAPSGPRTLQPYSVIRSRDVQSHVI